MLSNYRADLGEDYSPQQAMLSKVPAVEVQRQKSSHLAIQVSQLCVTPTSPSETLEQGLHQRGFYLLLSTCLSFRLQSSSTIRNNAAWLNQRVCHLLVFTLFGIYINR
ncbi:hypothetical protein TNCV_1992261 [Trichonephila clavipes]|nr:hypothetical protein TNCV_1992261 [Trichonephila clavipes]